MRWRGLKRDGMGAVAALKPEGKAMDAVKHKILARIMFAWRAGRDIPHEEREAIVAEFDSACVCFCGDCGSHDIVVRQVANVRPNAMSIVALEEDLIGDALDGKCATCGSTYILWPDHDN